MEIIKEGNDIIRICREEGITISELAIKYEMEKSGRTREEIREYMRKCLDVMKGSVKKALESDGYEIRGKIIGGQARTMWERCKKGKTASGDTMARAISYALSTMEVNASMGKIVAAPTAGSCGVIPAVLLSIKETYDLDDEKLIDALLVASIIGMTIAINATLSGAEGGCQAEVGSASAMAAGAVVSVLGGTPEMSFDAGAMALKNLMGLVCDPIAGLVESPCSKRNAIGTANALICADMALSGIKCVVPFDQVVVAMKKVGNQLPCELRETALGGVAVTPTAIEIAKRIFGDKWQNA